MSVSNPNLNVTRQDLADFYDKIFPYLGGRANAGFTPVGTIISVMGVNAPANYLKCDGTVYNISDYPELAAYFGQQFSMINKFGGNGTTTFAVPDLRGEFLRGTGTNSHTIPSTSLKEGSGADVGTHQGASWINKIGGNANSTEVSGVYIGYNNVDIRYSPNKDVEIATTQNVTKNLATINKSSNAENTTWTDYYTARPTNTSVLFCIATKNIYMNPSLDYSTDEKVVGSWIDGSTLYQRTVHLNNISIPTAGTTGDYTVLNDSSLKMIYARGILIDTALNTNSLQVPFEAINRTSGLVYWNAYIFQDKTSKAIVLRFTNYNGSILTWTDGYVNIQYTKTT